MLALLAVWVRADIYLAVMSVVAIGLTVYSIARKPKDKANQDEALAAVRRCSNCNSIIGRGSTNCATCGSAS